VCVSVCAEFTVNTGMKLPTVVQLQPPVHAHTLYWT